jgi:hypothetical protein
MTQTGGSIPAAVGFIKFCPRRSKSWVSETCGTCYVVSHEWRTRSRYPWPPGWARQALKVERELARCIARMRGKRGAGFTADIHGINALSLKTRVNPYSVHQH